MTLYKWSQTAAADASADSTINWAEGQSPSINDSARAMMAATAKWRDDITGIATTGGSGGAYTISSNQVITSNTNGFTVQFTPGTTNTGAVTLSVDGQAAMPLRFLSGSELLAGTLISGSLYQATYRAASSEWLLHSFDARLYSIPLGSSVEYWGTTVPNSAFVFPYGQTISRVAYATLFSLFGTTYGVGDGSTTFNIPDLRGRVVAGKDGMGGSVAGRLTSSYFGTSAAALGAVGGLESHTLTTPQIPSHTHANSLTDPGHTHSYNQNAPFGASGAGAGINGASTGGATSSALTNITINNVAAGGGGAHNNVQPTIICNKILRII